MTMPDRDGLGPAPTNFFMTIRDVAFWLRSARADSLLGRFRRDQEAGSAFDRLYAGNHDPFGAELPQYRYQRRKYDSLLSMLPQRRYQNVLDVGCGLGAFTRRLAPFADRVLGTDISAEAVRQARKLSDRFPNVGYLQRDMFDSCRQDEKFDLIVIADALYYLDPRTPEELKRIAAIVSSLLMPGGLLLIVNHYFFGIDRASRETSEIHDAFRWAPALDRIAEHRRAFFLATILRRSAR
jgi:predicted TPR repeat methyltransferase